MDIMIVVVDVVGMMPLIFTRSAARCDGTDSASSQTDWSQNRQSLGRGVTVTNAATRVGLNSCTCHLYVLVIETAFYTKLRIHFLMVQEILRFKVHSHSMHPRFLSL